VIDLSRAETDPARSVTATVDAGYQPPAGRCWSLTTAQARCRRSPRRGCPPAAEALPLLPGRTGPPGVLNRVNARIAGCPGRGG
jgi:hypothetical protein